MKKNNIKTKVIATALSAITVLSVGAMTTTTAFAAETHLSAGTTLTDDLKVSLDRDLKYATKITSETILKVLSEATPYGKYFAPALGGLLDAFIEKPEERMEQKLTEINDKVDKIFGKIDASEASIKAELTNDLGVQSFYNTFVKFKSQTEAMNKKIKQIYASNLSNADKVAKIGSLTGRYSEWRANFEDVHGELNNLIKKPTLTKNGNIFELAYNHYTNSVLFSGEALDKAKPVCDYVNQVYSAGCATIIESLTAQLYYNNLTADTKNTVNKDYASHICTNNGDIENEIKLISKDLVNKDNPNNTIKGMYDKVFATSRSIFVNKGHDNTTLNKALKMHDHTNDPKANGIWGDDRGETAANNFNDKIANNAISFENVKAIADYAKSKGMTIRELLNKNGFDTSNLPKNTNIVTKKAFDDSVSKLSAFVMYNYQKAYYNGVNIDAKGATEQKIQILDCGINGWKWEKWNYMKGGNACVFQNA